MKSQWTHKKYKTPFVGSYQRLIFKVGGTVMTALERVFVLTNGKRTISFESWQAAKKAGWVKFET